MSLRIIDEYGYPATDKQVVFIDDLFAKRDTATLTDTMRHTLTTLSEMIERAAETDKPIIIQMSRRDASYYIDTLLRCRPINSKKTDELNATLGQLPVSRYALPRKNDPDVWDFFELVERKNGRRFMNRLLGSPGDWRRDYLCAELQIAAARAIALDPRASAVAYAKRHRRCAVCDAPLSHPTSIEFSMGPTCRKRFL
ncbi:MAG: hypothetical protein A2Y75_05285 [Candidatus Solincola sediminis]|uniref:Uncharacterized protein n=1 Tax=Candidatus Solincola sediminis TaxID=1797199 RepID=A0A1F2WG69_9ACTN|nr:MAG: hypothetical protein A2Y75_05285 [Candidatus Solincola sediminis]